LRAGNRDVQVEPSNVVGVFGMGSRISEHDLRDAMYKLGQVEPHTIKIITDRKTGVSKGFGFATFNTIDEAQKCIDTLHKQVTFVMFALEVFVDFFCVGCVGTRASC
jgi:RNA recognition motif-containing protein